MSGVTVGHTVSLQHSTPQYTEPAQLDLHQDHLACPVCKSLLRDPFVTACGHSFCYECVSQHLAQRKNCPSCAAYLTFDLVYPNFLLQGLAARVKSADQQHRASIADRIHQLLHEADSASDGPFAGGHASSSGSLSEADLEGLLVAMYSRKQALQQQSAQDSLQLLLHFLNFSREAKRQKLRELQGQLQTLEGDISLVASQSDALPEPAQLAAGGMLQLPPSAVLLHSRLQEVKGGASSAGPSEASTPGRGHEHPMTFAATVAMPQPLTAEQPQRPLRASVPRITDGRPEDAQARRTPCHFFSEVRNPVPDALGDGGAAAADNSPSRLLHRTSAESIESGRMSSGSQQQAAEADHLAASAAMHQHISSAEAPAMSHTPASSDAAGSLESGGTNQHSSGSPSLLAGRQAVQAPAERSSPSGDAPAAMFARLLPPAAAGALASPTAAQPADEGREKRRKRVAAQLKDLQQCYLALRSQQRQLEVDLLPGAAAPLGCNGDAAGAEADAAEASDAAAQLPSKRLRPDEEPMVTSGAEPQGLAEFSRMLSVFTHFGSLQVVAQVPRASPRQSSAILSSIEFDRDAQLFATAGVSKRICIFDFTNVMRNPLQTQHCPFTELSTRSKLSCLSWNKYVRSHLISSDYEGVVALWDVSTGQQLADYEAHDKRIWTVDFCHSDPMHFISGSDDGFVKIWSTKVQDSLAQIDMKANVCCVKYNPASAHEVAIGCADHCVHVYDLRRTDRAISVLAGHNKAVAYVRFMGGGGEVVSASTDSTLRLWDLRGQASTRTYRGHFNEKNFVGLSADGEFIACGSEQNEIFVYYKSMSRPIASQNFATPPVSAGAGAADVSGADGNQFISAVAWKPHTNTLLAANSSGVVKICSLTHD